MPARQQSIMRSLYGEDIWEQFKPIGVPESVQGWNGDHPSLKRLAGGADRTVVDVGVWKGLSTITMATAMKSAGIDGCVIAVDTFLGSPEHWDGSGPDRFFDRVHGRPNLFEIFMSNVALAGVQDYIVPLPQTSVTAAKILLWKGVNADIVHVDAAHEYEEVLRDAEEYWKIIVPGGYLVGDDYDFTWPGVVRAAGEFSARTLRPLQIEPPKWIIQKA